MDPLLQPIAEFIAQHRVWAGVVLGAVTLVESLVIVGAFVPATALLVLAGGLIAAGVLDPVSVVVGCVTGAVVGDAISFAIGRRLGPSTLRHPWLAAHRRNIARTRLFCRRYGVASVYVGRFFGPLRAFVPVVLGILRMGKPTFQVANVCSAVIWVLAVLAPGYFAAKGLAQLEILAEAHPVTLVGLGVAILAAGGFALWRTAKARAAKQMAALEARNAHAGRI